MIFVMSSHQNAPISLKGESIIKVMVGTIIIMVFVYPGGDRRGDSSPSKTLKNLNLFHGGCLVRLKLFPLRAAL